MRALRLARGGEAGLTRCRGGAADRLNVMVKFDKKRPYTVEPGSRYSDWDDRFASGKYVAKSRSKRGAHISMF